MNLFPFVPSTSTICAAVLVAGIGIGGTGAAVYYRAQVANLKADALAQQAKAVQLVADAQQEQFDKLQGALDAAQKQTIAAQHDADAARSANSSLRQSLASFKAKHSAACTSAGEPSGDPIGVLTDLLGRMGEAGARISRYADEVKIAGLACEESRK